MIQRKTQTTEYWQSFALSSADTEHLYNLMLDAERPLPTRDLALALVAERCRREEAEWRSELGRGTIYQPKRQFAVGEKVIFPAIEFRMGEVLAVRPGQNREYGPFEVITVDFGPDRRQRDFAAGLAAPHKLNTETPDLLLGDELSSPETLLASVATDLPGQLAAQLAGDPNFATFEGRWLLSSLLAEIHVGHLNIAEALVDMRGEPVATDTLIKELDLPAEIARQTLAFSLQSALAADGRFDQVGSGDVRRWFLRRLEPPEALEIPDLLRYMPFAYDRSGLGVDLLQLEWELDDEWSEDGGVAPAAQRASALSTSILLTHPHLVSGTLSIGKQTRAFFPRGHGQRTALTLIDGRWGQRFSGWAVHDGRYVAGLRPWFDQHKLPAGALITLERKDASGEVVVDFKPKRMRREWTRHALVLDGARLAIQLRKQEVSCEYDELAIISHDRHEDILKLRASPVYAQAPLADLVYEIFVDLAGLSTAGTAHAKTVYAAFNVIRRCPPGPIFAVLATDRRFESAGDCLFRLAV